MVLDAFAGKLAEKIGSFVEESMVTVLGVKDELRKLQRKMEKIMNVLQDAEEKRITSKLVATWVRELKDVMYDAEDIIDICRFEGGKLLDEIGNKIKALNERLDQISKDVSDLNLLKNESDLRVTKVNLRDTTPLLDPSDVVGSEIEQATNKLVDLIAKKDGEHKCRLFAVTGMGGIGKTILAKCIFNHKNTQSAFPTKKWVCISQNYSQTALLKEIIRGVGGDPGNLESTAELLPRLESVVSGKPFLLVLDDVWRSDVWTGLLREALQSGAASSCVLVTTRNINIAREMGEVYIHPVEQLSEQSGWDLLCKSAFITHEEDKQRLRNVGHQIVEKCNRLPLAIKAIAGVLKTKERSKGEWVKVLRRDSWSMDKLPEDLRGALYLSYEDLPSHLKQCFLYWSLYPKDSIKRQDVVQHWVAEEFVEIQSGAPFLELADEYFEELVRRNLVQNYYGERYVMHDLLRSLCVFLSGDESFCGEIHQLSSTLTTTKLRRLSITNRNDEYVIPESLQENNSLRSLRFEKCPSTFGDNFFKLFPVLRCLFFKGSGLKHIPDDIGKLIHLRFLDLGCTQISHLPESIKNLTNLLFLSLSGCKSLHTLPDGITHLCSLRLIDLEDTPLHFMPAGMGKLEQLNVFRGFVVGVDYTRSGGVRGKEGCRLEELNSLMHLTELSIYNLQRAVVLRLERGPQPLLRNKIHLKLLKLYWKHLPLDSVTKAEEVLAELYPPPCLERLEIDGYAGRRFPYWMMSGTSLPQLRSLFLINCLNALEFPSLGLLPELRDLQIDNAPGVVAIGPEFFGDRVITSVSEICGDGAITSVSFPKLETLKLWKMGSLQEWSCGAEDEGRLSRLPHLQKLHVRDCPALKSLPRFPKQCPLKEVSIGCVGVRVVDNLSCLTDKMDISCCSWLERISDLQALRELEISDCDSLECVVEVDALEKLRIWDCSSLEKISGLQALTWLSITDCSDLEMISDLQALRGLVVMNCPNLRMISDLQALRVLTFEDDENEYLPEALLRFLQLREEQQRDNEEEEDFELRLICTDINLAKRCHMGCQYWPIIQHVPRVTVFDFEEQRNCLEYTKRPFLYRSIFSYVDLG